MDQNNRRSAPSGTIAVRQRVFPRDGRRSFARHVGANLPTLLTVMAAMFFLERAGWLKGFETFGLDALVTSQVERPGLNIVIVKVDDVDYRDFFGGRSPLDAEKLRRLLGGIAAGKPRLIAVDLDTADRGFAMVEFPDAVWARDAEPLCEEPPPETQADERECLDAEDVKRQQFLGGNFRERQPHDMAIETEPSSGVVLFPLDSDGVLRRYRRTYQSSAADPPSAISGRVVSFPWAIARQYKDVMRALKQPCDECGNVEALEKSERETHGAKIHGAGEVVLNFSYDRRHFKRINARNLMAAADQAYWQDKALVRDAIVLVGGAYRADRDEYHTPVGRRFGVELVAQAIEADVLHRGISEVNHRLALLLDLLNSFVLMYINWRWPSRRTFLLSLAAVIVLSLAGSYLAFNALAYWFNFMAVLLGLWLHMLYEGALERRELRHELEQLRRELNSNRAHS